MEEEGQEQVHQLSPGMLGLIALLSIGGLIFLGWQSSIVGHATIEPYSMCCSVATWQYSASGWMKGEPMTQTAYCDALDNPRDCCAKSVKTDIPVRVLGMREGACNPPQKSYPAPVPPSREYYQSCCTMQTWKHAPTGYAQGTAQTSTQFCAMEETPPQCCVRAFSDAGYDVRLLGARKGGCNPAVPQKSYPIFVH